MASNQADVRKADNAIENAPKQSANLYTPRGSASRFDGGKYDVNNMMYPTDLMKDVGNSYGRNYVIFYINVATDSKLVNNSPKELFVEENIPRDRGDLLAQGFTGKSLTAANAVTNTLAGFLGGSIATSSLGGAALGVGAANSATVGAGVAATQAASATRSQKRLKTAIALHVPNQLQIRYGVQWSDEDTAALAMAGAGAEELMKAFKSLGKDSDVKGVGAAVITNLALSKGPNAAANSAALGLAANPKKEQVFKGVDFRTFTFEYQFFPRDIKEAETVMNIIREFKYHMHPEFKDSNNFVYIYPSEFDIFYYQNGKENMNLHRHTSCVLTEMSINYTPNGTFTTFSNGMPTQINVQMSFRELALLTKDKVKDGL